MTDIDWEHRKKVILEVQANKGTAKDAAKILGIATDTVLHASRRLGCRFPARHGFPDGMKRGKEREAVRKPNAGQAASKERVNTAWSAYHQRQRFAKALEAAPEQTVSDAELIAQAIADGKVTKVKPGFGLLTNIQFVRPRSGASRGVSV